MKKEYETPKLEIEIYTLDASIASNCKTSVSMGPGYGEYDACEEFDFDIVMYSAETPFYDSDDEKGGGVCTCYYTAGNSGFFAS